MKFNDYVILLLVIIIMLTFLLVGCDTLDTQESSENTASQTLTATPFINNTHEQATPIPYKNESKGTDELMPTSSPLNTFPRTLKIGYNSYGIPGAYMWRLYKDQTVLELRDNIDEIVIEIKNELNIPQCITGIPFNERAKELLIDDNGDLVSNWEEILEQLKSEWLDE